MKSATNRSVAPSMRTGSGEKRLLPFPAIKSSPAVKCPGRLLPWMPPDLDQCVTLPMDMCAGGQSATEKSPGVIQSGSLNSISTILSPTSRRSTPKSPPSIPASILLSGLKSVAATSTPHKLWSAGSLR